MINISMTIKTALLLLVGVIGAVVLFNPQPTQAQSNQEKILGQLCESDGGFDVSCNSNAAENKTERTFRRVILTALWVAGVVSVVMAIVGGLMLVFSSGGPEQTTRARNTILYALIGLGVAFIGIALLEFVLEFGATSDSTIANPGN